MGHTHFALFNLLEYVLSYVTYSRADPENSVGVCAGGGGGGVGSGQHFLCVLFLIMTYFTEGRTNLPREAMGPCFSREVRTSISKETYSHL